MESTPSTPFDRRPPYHSIQPMPMSTTPPSLFDHRQPVRSMPMISTLHQPRPVSTIPKMPEYHAGPFGLSRSMDEINRQLDWFVSYMKSTQRMSSQGPSSTATSSQSNPSGSSNFAGSTLVPGDSNEGQVELLIKGWIAKKLHETDLAPLPIKKGSHELLALTPHEESTIRCLINVFAFLNNPPSTNELTTPEATFRFNQFYCEKLLNACMYLPGFAKLSLADRYMLANYGWANILSVKNHLIKLARVNNWQAESQMRILPTSLPADPASDHSTFYELCTSPAVFCILVGVMIYNPDLVNLQGIEFIRQEQYTYIYLLRRYLENLLSSTERAKLEHYKLIYTTEKIMIIRQQTMYIEQFRRAQN